MIYSSNTQLWTRLYKICTITGKATVVQKTWQLKYQILNFQDWRLSMMQENWITTIWNLFGKNHVIMHATGLPLLPCRRIPLKSWVEFAYSVHFYERFKNRIYTLIMCRKSKILFIFWFIFSTICCAPFFHTHTLCSKVELYTVIINISFIYKNS